MALAEKSGSLRHLGRSNFHFFDIRRRAIDVVRIDEGKVAALLLRDAAIHVDVEEGRRKIGAGIRVVRQFDGCDGGSAGLRRSSWRITEHGKFGLSFVARSQRDFPRIEERDTGVSIAISDVRRDASWRLLFGVLAACSGCGLRGSRSGRGRLPKSAAGLETPTSAGFADCFEHALTASSSPRIPKPAIMASFCWRDQDEIMVSELWCCSLVCVSGFLILRFLVTGFPSRCHFVTPSAAGAVGSDMAGERANSRPLI